MANQWLVTNTIKSIKRRGFIPTADERRNGFQTEDFLSVIDEVVRGHFVPLLKRTRGEYITKRSDMTLTASRASYPLPARCAAEALKSVLVYDAGSGNWPPIDRIEPEGASDFQASADKPSAYYFEGDNVVFVPTPSGTPQVRFLYFNRPNRVVDPSDVCCISAIDTATKTVTVDSWDDDTEEFDTPTVDVPIPTTFSSAAVCDLVRGTPGFRSLDTDLVVASATTTSITFVDDLPDGLAIGDFVCIAGETPIAQIPAELHPSLAQECARLLLESKGDPKAAAAAKSADKLESEGESMLANRSSTSRKVVNKDAPGWDNWRRRR